MRHMEHEKAILLPTVNGDRDVFADVRLRLPDITFEDQLRIDLGGRVVEVWHFGRGNTPGDTVVYAPGARVAWTGNLVVGVGVPPVFEGGTRDYLLTISRLAATLDVETIVPGHGALASRARLGQYQTYLTDLLGAVSSAVDSGLGVEQTVAQLTLEPEYLPAADSPLAPLADFVNGLHQLNVHRTYLDLAQPLGRKD